MENDSVPPGIMNRTTSLFIAPVLPGWSVHLFIATNIIIMVLGVLGNGIILLVEQFNKQKTSTDWMIMFMAVNDFILTGCNSPIIILMYSGRWSKVGSDALCGFMFYVQENFSYSSALLLTVTAMDRYMKTCRPLTTVITPKRSLYICLGIAVFATFFSASIPFYLRYDDVALCRYHVTNPVTKSVFQVILYIIQGTYVAMFLIVIFSYCKIGYTIRNRQRKMMLSVQPFPLVSHNTANTSSRLVQNQSTQNTSVSMPDTHKSENGQTLKNIDHSMRVHNIQNTSENLKPGTSHNVNIKTNFEQTGNSFGGKDGKRDNQFNRQTINQDRHAALKQAQMNKTTAIMFAVTMVFILSWIPTWTNSIIWPKDRVHSEADNIAALFCRRAFMINTCTNPFFYIGMSSVFRKLTKETINKLWKRLRLRLNQ